VEDLTAQRIGPEESVGLFKKMRNTNAYVQNPALDSHSMPVVIHAQGT